MTDRIFNFLPGYFSDWLGIPISTNPRVVINVVAVLLLLFLGWYVVQAIRALFRLGLAVQDLEKVHQQKPNDEIVTKDDLQQMFKTAFFTSVWNSFRDTLHEQYDYQGGHSIITQSCSYKTGRTSYSHVQLFSVSAYGKITIGSGFFQSLSN